MSKKVLFAFLFGYGLRALQKSWLMAAVRKGARDGFIKALEKELPEVAAEARRGETGPGLHGV